MKQPPSIVYLCNGARAPSRAKRYLSAKKLEYRPNQQWDQNVEIALPQFVSQMLHIPARTLDLLEIAGYLFAGDRLARRGAVASLEYHSWSRSMEFVVKVRDAAFWCQPAIGKAMADALRFMTGDRSYTFTFQAGHSTPATHLFDTTGVVPPRPANPRVMLFSGGLDSLAGALETLSVADTTACFVSHESQHGTIKTQRGLIRGVQDRFPGRVVPYSFKCRLSDRRAAEETQRTRSFLYLSVAFAVARGLGVNEVSVFENGFTAFALPERQDLLNARASRTTHPKTMSLMASFLSSVAGEQFTVASPFRWSTKSDILRVISNRQATDLLTSSVSCSATFHTSELGRQCGKCSQCIERRFAAYAAGLGDIDASGTYALDFIRDPIEDGEARALLIDYLRLARSLCINREEWFVREKLNELADLVPFVDGGDETERTTRVWTLCHRHGEEVFNALRAIRNQHDDPARPRPVNTLLDIIAEQDYLKSPVEQMVGSLATRLRAAIPIAFKTKAPSHENSLNDQIEAILKADAIVFEREYPSVRFGTAKTVPDHSSTVLDLFIEAKLLREKTAPSKITDELAADTVKYEGVGHILFVLYDPARAIADDAKFSAPFLKTGRCTLCIVR